MENQEGLCMKIKIEFYNTESKFSFLPKKNIIPEDLTGQMLIIQDELELSYADLGIGDIKSTINWLLDLKKPQPNKFIESENISILDERPLWKKTFRIFSLEFDEGLQLTDAKENLKLDSFSPNHSKEIKRVLFKELDYTSPIALSFDLMRPEGKGYYGISYEIKKRESITVNKKEFIKELTETYTTVINELIKKQENLKEDKNLIELQVLVNKIKDTYKIK